MKILGHKPSFNFGRRNSSDPKSSSESYDEDGAPTRITAQLLPTARSSPDSSRRQSLKEAWASIKKVVKKKASLPEFLLLRRNTCPAPTVAPVEPVTLPKPASLDLDRVPSYREIAVRPRTDTDDEEAAFGDCIFELMKRCPKYHRYLDRQTKAQLVLEGRADQSIWKAGSSDETTLRG